MSRRPFVDRDRADLLYAEVVQSGRYNTHEVARKAELSYDLLKKLWEGERSILPKHLPKLYRGTGSVALFDALSGAADCGLLVTERPTAREVVPGDVRAGMGRVHVALAKAIESQEEALADGVFDDGERAEIFADIAEAHRRLEEYRARVEAAPRPLVRRSAR